MSVMMLAAGKGTVLDLEIEGSDEEAALEALQPSLRTASTRPNKRKAVTNHVVAPIAFRIIP